MQVFVEPVLIVFANILFLFLYWKKLKEDYIAHQIFTSAFYMIAVFLISVFLALKMFPFYWFWFAFFGIVGITFFSSWRFHMRMTEMVEAIVAAVLPVMGIGFFYNFLNAKETSGLFGMGIIAILLFLYLWLDKHYKKFTWYKSGKVGFAGFVVMGVFFLLRIIVVKRFPYVLSFPGNADVYMSALFSFLSFFIVFYLSAEKR